MTINGRLKDWWHSKTKRWGIVCEWMNSVSRFINRFSVVPPLMMQRVNGSAVIGLAVSLEGIDTHPWRLNVRRISESDVRLSVTGGKVWMGIDHHEVNGLTEWGAADNVKVWLEISYPPSHQADETWMPTFTVKYAEDWPEPTTIYDDPLNGVTDFCNHWAPFTGDLIVNVPLAEYVKDAEPAVRQHQFGTIQLPFGVTGLLPRCIRVFWDNGWLKAVYVREWYINGRLVRVEDPVCTNLFNTGPCPTPP